MTLPGDDASRRVLFMPMDDFSPDLSKLDDDYQLLTELHRGPDSQTYLARHRGLNRDVTITVVRAIRDETTGVGNDLSHFASDARLLATMRHQNVIPVIEGRWLGNDAFAIVRARVRGSTLDELVSATGPLALPRAASALEQVQDAIEWARANGVAHRHVSPDSLVFQQGSGRVLVALEPATLAVGGLPNACDDARTIGALASTMLIGKAGATDAEALANARPDLPPRVVTATKALITCDRGGTAPDVRGYLALLGEAEGDPRRATPPASAAAPAAAAVSAGQGRTEDSVVVVNRPFGFGARLATAIAVAAVIVVMAALLLHRRGSERGSPIGATAQTDTAAQSSGDVALHARQADTALLAAAPPPSVVASPAVPPNTSMPSTVEPVVPPATAVVPPTTGSAMAPSVGGTVTPPASSPVSPIAPPLMRRREPTRTPPSQSVPAPTPSAPVDSARPERDAVQRDTAPVRPGDACSSPAAADQQQCLATAVERADRDLNAVYQRLITGLRRQANAQPNDPDPSSVNDLRATQRKWLESRDAACHDVGDAPLFAQARAACYADQSAQRTKELQQILDSLPPG